VICWDGAGGSKKRKATNKSYKEGRAPIRLNRDIRNLSESEEITNKIWQQTRLFEYLNEMPIIQFMYEGIEADDIIAYVQRHPSLQGSQKMIVSSDKDFFQLLDDETILHRPIQKENLNRNRIIEQYGIHPNNFALARAVVGDVSDNLPGIKGVGLGTIAKRLPFMAEEESCTINALVKFCKENNENNLKAFTNIVEGKKLIAENYKMMQLYSPSISVQTKRDIDAIFKEFTPALNKTMIRKMFVEDGIGELSINDLFVNFKSLIYTHKEQQTT
jgi:5'-3' exonuclease